MSTPAMLLVDEHRPEKTLLVDGRRVRLWHAPQMTNFLMDYRAVSSAVLWGIVRDSNVDSLGVAINNRYVGVLVQYRVRDPEVGYYQHLCLESAAWVNFLFMCIQPQTQEKVNWKECGF